MTTKTEQKASPLDTVKMILAAAILVGSLVAYYYYSEYSQLYRVAGVVAAVAISILVAMQTEMGRNFWRFAQGSRIELRKVVWPTREEALQTTIYVIIFVIIMGVFFWVLDMVLLWASRALTGQGG